METWLFWGLAAVAIVAALLAVGQRSAVRAIVMMAVLLAASGGLYLLLAAPVAAFVQIVLYAGALVAVAVPATLWLDPPDEIDDGAEVVSGAGPRRFGLLLVIALVVELTWAFQQLRGASLPPAEALPPRGLAVVGRALVTDQAGSVLLVVLLVLVAVAGVSLLTRHEAR